MPFEIKIAKAENVELYKNHTTYHSGDSGLDLFIVDDYTFQPNETKLIDLGISCQLWEACFKESPADPIRYFSYLMYPRSSIAKTPLRLANSIGLIDRGYTGNLMAALHNTSVVEFTIKRGERYVQLVKADLGEIEFEIVDSLRDTTRGSGGFGSTS